MFFFSGIFSFFWEITGYLLKLTIISQLYREQSPGKAGKVLLSVQSAAKAGRVLLSGAFPS